MGNRKAREYLLRREQEVAWEKSRTDERPASADIPFTGVGHRRIQVIRCPAFEDGTAWEVRQELNEWRAFRSKVVGGRWPDVRLVGYDPLRVDSPALERCFVRLAAMSVPLSPLHGQAGADGTSYQLATFDLFCGWRVQWWEEPPPQWATLAEITAELISLFTSAVRDGC